MAEVGVWQRYEVALRAGRAHADPTHEVELTAEFRSPSGASHRVRGFWDGGDRWRVRCCPDEVGGWSFTTSCPTDPALDGVTGTFRCAPYDGDNPLYARGAVRVSADGHHLVHADGTPFFFLADTCWNGPMKAAPDDWAAYLDDRVRRRFSAVQYLATQFRASTGSADGHRAYVGKEHIRIVPEFFQWMDARVDAINDHGLLAVPLLLHAESDTTLNPGHDLGPDQLAVLGRYLVARYGAHHVLWNFVAEARFHGEHAEQWRRLGRAVFDLGQPHPVTLHPHGQDWVLAEFADEAWMDVVGYQSGHRGDDEAWRWIVAGPPATDWRRRPPRPFLNLEPPYEGHASYAEGRPFDAATMRRACYWSLLVSPTAGVAYGAHGVWGWDDGSGPPMGHPSSGTPLPWRAALDLPGSTQLAHLADMLTSVAWWRLRPCQELLVDQPGEHAVADTVVAAQAPERSVTVVYLPSAVPVRLRADGLPGQPGARWHDPRTGASQPAELAAEQDQLVARPPSDGDWVLVLEAAQSGG